MEDRLGPVIKSGRAAFGVVIKGYMERLRPEGYNEPDLTTVEYSDKIVNWVTDIRRGLDYLETRSDLDSTRIGFFGPSAGSRTGLVLAAVENRYRSIFLMGAGLSQSDARRIAGANPVDFAPHISAPKLMLHGRYDEDVDRKSTRLNSSHLGISYAVFCLKKKNKISTNINALPHVYSGSLTVDL